MLDGNKEKVLTAWFGNIPHLGIDIFNTVLIAQVAAELGLKYNTAYYKVAKRKGAYIPRLNIQFKTLQAFGVDAHLYLTGEPIQPGGLRLYNYSDLLRFLIDLHDAEKFRGGGVRKKSPKLRYFRNTYRNAKTSPNIGAMTFNEILCDFGIKCEIVAQVDGQEVRRWHSGIQ